MKIHEFKYPRTCLLSSNHEIKGFYSSWRMITQCLTLLTFFIHQDYWMLFFHYFLSLNFKFPFKVIDVSTFCVSTIWNDILSNKRGEIVSVCTCGWISVLKCTWTSPPDPSWCWCSTAPVTSRRLCVRALLTCQTTTSRTVPARCSRRRSCALTLWTWPQIRAWQSSWWRAMVVGSSSTAGQTCLMAQVHFWHCTGQLQ